MPTYDAIVVFGSKLQTDGRFPNFVYEELDKAVELAEYYSVSRLVVCGGYPMNHGRRGLPLECDVAERYLDKQFSRHEWKVVKEAESVNLPENWLYLRLLLSKLGISRPRLLIITLRPLLDRNQFLGEKVFGPYGRLKFVALPTAVSFPRERLVLGDTKHILQDMQPGDISFLLGPDGKSRWEVLRQTHHTTCPYRGKLDPM